MPTRKTKQGPKKAASVPESPPKKKKGELTPEKVVSGNKDLGEVGVDHNAKGVSVPDEVPVDFVEGSPNSVADVRDRALEKPIPRKVQLDVETQPEVKPEFCTVNIGSPPSSVIFTDMKAAIDFKSKHGDETSFVTVYDSYEAAVSAVKSNVKTAALSPVQSTMKTAVVHEQGNQHGSFSSVNQNESSASSALPSGEGDGCVQTLFVSVPGSGELPETPTKGASSSMANLQVSQASSSSAGALQLSQGTYDFSNIDDGCINTKSVQAFQRSKEEEQTKNTTNLVFAMTRSFTVDNQAHVVVPFFLEEDRQFFWAFKAVAVKETLEYLSKSTQAFSSLIPVVDSMRVVQLRDIPFGANVGRVVSGKKGTFPVETLTFFVSGKGKILPAVEEAKAIAGGLKQILGSRMFRDVYLEVLRGNKKTNKLGKALESENNYVWTIFKKCGVDIQFNTPMNKFLLNSDIRGCLEQCGVKDHHLNWDGEVKIAAFKDGVIPGDF